MSPTPIWPWVGDVLCHQGLDALAVVDRVCMEEGCSAATSTTLPALEANSRCRSAGVGEFYRSAHAATTLETDPQGGLAWLIGLPVRFLGGEDGPDRGARIYVQFVRTRGGRPTCGSVAWVKGHIDVELIDLPIHGRAARTVWRKYRFACPAPTLRGSPSPRRTTASPGPGTCPRSTSHHEGASIPRSDRSLPASAHQ